MKLDPRREWIIVVRGPNRRVYYLSHCSTCKRRGLAKRHTPTEAAERIRGWSKLIPDWAAYMIHGDLIQYEQGEAFLNG